jgi:hypothetical protein
LGVLFVGFVLYREQKFAKCRLLRGLGDHTLGRVKEPVRRACGLVLILNTRIEVAGVSVAGIQVEAQASVLAEALAGSCFDTAPQISQYGAWA